VPRDRDLATQTVPTALSSFSPWQATSLVILRTLIGWHFLYEGYYKWSLPAWTADGKPLGPFSAAGYIKAGDGPLAGLAKWALDAGLLPWINGLVIFGLVAVGISLMLGLLTQAGCLGGLALLTMFYFTAIPTTGLPQAGAEGTYLFINKTLIEGVAVLALFTFDTGRIAGLDRVWKQRRGASPSVSLDRHTFAEGSGS
jgi:thiosulfate dehydrogenase (quinone) large subunit